MRSSRPTGAGTTPHLSRHGDTRLVPGAQGRRLPPPGAVAGVAAKDDECLVGGYPEPPGEDSPGLPDDDPAVQRDLQLPGHDLLVAHGAFLRRHAGRVDELQP
jgi:hypothetical protein